MIHTTTPEGRALFIEATCAALLDAGEATLAAELNDRGYFRRDLTQDELRIAYRAGVIGANVAGRTPDNFPCQACYVANPKHNSACPGIPLSTALHTTEHTEAAS